MFTDDLLQFQTYLTGIDGPGFAVIDGRSPVLDIMPVWADYRGRGVSVGIDGPFDRLHPDLQANYDTGFLGQFDPEPLVQTEPAAAIGTFLAGIVGADDNGFGLVGLAPDVSMTAFDAEPFAGTDIVVTLPRGDRFDDALAAYEAAPSGRNGLGTIVVTAPPAGSTFYTIYPDNAPSGEVLQDYALHTMRHVITASGVSHAGLAGNSRLEGDMMLVGAPAFTDTASSFPFDDTVLTFGLDSRDGFGVGGGLGLWRLLAETQTGVTIDADQYLQEPTGLGGSAVTAGVVALMLEANPALGWRDVQKIFAYSALLTGYDTTQTRPSSEPWQENGATTKNTGGLFYKADVGFGAIDVYGAVRLAETWGTPKTSANEATVTATNQQAIPSGVFTFDPSREFTFTAPTDITIEHVELDIDYETSGGFQSADADELAISVISPLGTVSYMTGAETFINADQQPRFDQVYMSRRFWGEKADAGNGVWTVRIETFGSFQVNLRLRDLDLRFHGDGAVDDDTYIFTEDFGETTNTIIDDDTGVNVINTAALRGDVVLRTSGRGGRDGTEIYNVTAATDIDVLIAGDGNDILIGDTSAERLSGGRGRDTLLGRAGDDTLEGGAGNDTLVGSAGADRLDGGDGDGDTARYDTAVRADLANPVLNTAEASGDTYHDIEYLLGSSGSDDLRGDAGANRIVANGGDDFLTGRDGDDSLFGQRGDDVLRGDGGADVLDGGAGIDRADYTSASRVDLVAMQVNTGDAAGDTLLRIENLRGSDGIDDLRGDEGNNVLEGGGGDDMLTGRGGDDTLAGGAGDDALRGGTGADFLNGGGGVDRALYESAVRADLQTAGVNTGEANGDTYSSVEGLRGSAGRDDLRGNAGANELDGRNGDDWLTGRAGNDVLRGGNGDDLLRGGTGNDVLIGGGGADRIRFDAPGEGIDRIVGMGAQDTIEFVGANFSGLQSGALPDHALRFGAVALDGNDRILYASGTLRYDPDGNGGATAIILATIDGAPVLDTSDFFVL